MKRLKILSLPQMHFAHTYKSDEYQSAWLGNTNLMEVTYITSGSLRFSVGQDIYEAREGDIICLGATVGSNIVNIKADGYHSHHTVCFYISAEYIESADPCLPEIPLITTVPDGSPKCLNYIDDIIYAHTIHPHKSDIKCVGLFLELLNEISLINERSRDSFNSGEYYYVRKTKKYIYMHLAEPIRQQDIAAYLGITPEYLCAVFKKNEGCSVMRYVNNIKLARIRSLIENDHMPLNRAAAMYGYSDPNYVSRLYKKYHGTSITESINNTDHGRYEFPIQHMPD